MKIDDDHLYHGAALIQIAEHPQFTAINAFNGKSTKYENAYQINGDIAVYLKYASKPNQAYNEYVFTFNKSNLKELADIDERVSNTFLALVCVKAKEVCALSYEQLLSLIRQRRKEAGHDEKQYTVLVTAEKGNSLHVYMNAPNRKKTKLQKRDIIVSRNAFPDALFK